MKTTILTSLGLALCLGLTSAIAPADEDASEIARAQRPSYPMERCVVTGRALDGEHEPFEFVHKKRLFLLASEEVAKKVEADFETYASRLNAAVIERQTPIYPVETCVVSGEELGSMGRPLELVHGTRLVRLCCKGCRKAFYKDPEKFIAKVDEAMVAHQREHYPLEKCVVSGEALGAMGEPIDRLYGVTLVRLCCKGCIRAFDKNPRQFVAKVRAARGESRPRESSHSDREKHEREHAEGHGHDGDGEGHGKDHD